MRFVAPWPGAGAGSRTSVVVYRGDSAAKAEILAVAPVLSALLCVVRGAGRGCAGRDIAEAEVEWSLRYKRHFRRLALVRNPSKLELCYRSGIEVRAGGVWNSNDLGPAVFGPAVFGPAVFGRAVSVFGAA